MLAKAGKRLMVAPGSSGGGSLTRAIERAGLSG